MAKQDKWIIYTPVVELAYCYLLRPDSKFGEPTYKAEFLLSEAQAKQMAEKLEGDSRAKKGNKTLRVKGTKVDGKIKFRAKQKATITWKDKGEVVTSDMKPKVLRLVDGETVEYEGNWILPGSTAELELEVVPYDQQGGGLTLRLRGVRLHDVKEGEPMTEGGSWGEAAFDAEAPTTDSSSSDDDDDEGSDERNW